MKLHPIRNNVKKTIRASARDITWHQDERGYFLIRLDRKKRLIEVGFCTNRHEVTAKIIGKSATEIYYCIIRHRLVGRLEHAAYLGKELTRAESCLKNKKKYIQDS